MIINHLHQATPQSCGHVCATMLLESQNIPVLVDELMDVFPLTERGLSLKDLQVLFSQYKIETSLFQWRFIKSTRKITPLIVRLNQDLKGHYVIIWKYFFGHVLVSDPALEHPLWVKTNELDNKTIKYFGISLKNNLVFNDYKEWGWKIILISLSVWLLINIKTNTLFEWQVLLGGVGLTCTYIIHHHFISVKAFPTRNEIDNRMGRLFSPHDQMQIELRLSHLQILFNKKAQQAKMKLSVFRYEVDMFALLITLVLIQPLNFIPIGIWLLFIPYIILSQTKQKKTTLLTETAQFENELRKDLIHLKWLESSKLLKQRVKRLVNQLMNLVQNERKWIRTYYIGQVVKGTTIGFLLLLVALFHAVISTPSGNLEWILLFSFLFALETWDFGMKSFDFST